MKDKPAPVVPIKPDVQLQQPRSRAMLEFVAQCLIEVELEQEPVAIAFMIYGKDGLTRCGWQNDDEIGESALQALAAVKLGHLAGCEDRD